MLWRLFCLESERLNRGSTRWIAGEVQLGGPLPAHSSWHGAGSATQVCREVIQAEMSAPPQLSTLRFSSPRHL